MDKELSLNQIKLVMAIVGTIIGIIWYYDWWVQAGILIAAVVAIYGWLAWKRADESAKRREALKKKIQELEGEIGSLEREGNDALSKLQHNLDSVDGLIGQIYTKYRLSS